MANHPDRITAMGTLTLDRQVRQLRVVLQVAIERLTTHMVALEVNLTLKEIRVHLATDTTVVQVPLAQRIRENHRVLVE